MDEEYKKALESYEDELNEVIKYSNMCNMSNNALHKQFYKDMAKDEYSHASILKHMLQRENKFETNDRILKLENEVEKVHATF